jgi:hypothetical protein
MRPVRVILHCSASPDKGDNIGAKEIDRMHREERGFRMIGYHRVVRRTGAIELGRKDNVQGAHVEGHNADCLGVCWVGSYDPTEEQIKSLLILYQEFKLKFGIPWGAWIGHYEIVNYDNNPRNNKDCPGISMPAFRRLLKSFDNGDFAVNDTAPIKAFLQLASVRR